MEDADIKAPDHTKYAANTKQSGMTSYLDPNNPNQAMTTRQHFATITKGKTPPVPVPVSKPPSVGSSPPGLPAPSSSSSGSQTRSHSARSARTPSPRGSATEKEDQQMSGASPHQLVMRGRHVNSPSVQTNRSYSPKDTPPRQDRKRSPLSKDIEEN